MMPEPQELDPALVVGHRLLPGSQGNGVLFGRQCQLIVTGDNDPIDLSEFRIKFELRQTDYQTPNTAVIRVYNLAAATVSKIQHESQKVILQAGYVNAGYGQIFYGTIKQFRFGKEKNVDSYLDILAADGDVPYNNSVMCTNQPAGTTQAVIGQTLSNSFQGNGAGLTPDAKGLIGGVDPGTLARGKVLFGMTRDYMRDWSQKNGFRWSFQNGKLVMVPISGYRPGEAVILNSKSGLIGTPEATNGGIRVRCLLNPLIRVGGLVQIDNRDINTTDLVANTGFNAPNVIDFAASVTADGFYRVLVCEFSGDTRGQPWYADLVCIAVDKTAAEDDSVAVDG